MGKELFVCGALLTAACGPMPQTAAEFRTAVRDGAFMTEVTSFDAKRPLGDVAQTFQARAPECLSVSVQTESRTSTSYQNILAVYKPTLHVAEKRAELHVQRHYERGVVNVQDEPAGGYYLLVADATPIDEATTHVDIYAPSSGSDVLIGAVKNWATGESTACPDLTKE